jgi:molybdenum cofactor cytidylyltransferase
VKFGPVPVRKAIGGVLAHAVKEGDLVIRKGVVVDAAHVEALLAAGIAEVTVAQLERGDVGEDEAARRLAEAAIDVEVVAEAPFTGRVNIFAASAGVLRIDAARIHAANAVSEEITIATLADFAAVTAGEMVATVKIIPFAVPGKLLAAAISEANGAVRVNPFREKKVAVFSTLLPGLKPATVAKTMKVLDDRLQKLDGSSRVCDIRVHHEIEDLAEVLPRARAMGADIAVVFGASAISDRRDVIPAAVVAAGGRVEHLGMPVDPGNLIMIGELDGLPVIGAPGCARSPKENGFDWVLERLAADMKVTSKDIQAMGVGGLLMEIVTRPQPRDPEPAAGVKVAGVLLAAGKGSRMGGGKMTVAFAGKPLVRHAAEALCESGLAQVVVVTGHDAEHVASALGGLDVNIVHNADFATGMASSLKAAVASLSSEIDAALVALGDMPHVTTEILNRLVGAFATTPQPKAVVPVVEGRRGNPVLIGRGLFPDVMRLEGDVGARRLLEAAGDAVVEVEIADAAVLIDLDTPEALHAAGQPDRR